MDENRKDWIAEVIRCATLAHDAAGEHMQDGASNDPLGRLVTIVEIGIAHQWIDAEGALREPDDRPLVAGDTVQLRSGGPMMTLDRLDGDRVLCVWFMSPQVPSASDRWFSLHMLRRIEPGQAP